MDQIDPRTKMGAVALVVSDRLRSRRFYVDVIGLEVIAESDDLLLGTGGRTLLRLTEAPGAQPAPRFTGLYHVALLVPDRAALAMALRHYADVNAPFVGFADHTVSEALYLQDPDGHGIEVYRDRPREAWYDAQGKFLLTTDPLDAEGVLSELPAGAAWSGLAPETVMGHVHLQVADVAAAREFYTGVLGYTRMADYPGATFVSAGGYHHHLGLNAWRSRGAGPAPAGAARLLYYETVLPDQAALDAVARRLETARWPYERKGDTLLAADSSHNQIHFRVG